MPYFRSLRAPLALLKMKVAAVAAAFIAIVAVSPTRAPAAATFNFAPINGDIVGTLSGSLDFTGAQHFSTPSYNPRVYPKGGYVNATPGNSSNGITADIYSTTGPDTFGDGTGTDGIATGTAFEIDGSRAVVPQGYNGGPLTNTLTLPGETYASAGIIPGTYVFTIDGTGDTVTVNFLVPEPTALCTLAFGGVLLLARRRRPDRQVA